MRTSISPPPKMCRHDQIDVTMVRSMRLNALQYLRTYGTEDSDFLGAELIVGEIIGNVVRHAAGHTLVGIEWNGRRPTMIVSDSGSGFEVDTIRNESDSTSENGRGIFLVRQFAYALTVERNDRGGSCVRVVLPVLRQASDPDEHVADT